MASNIADLASLVPLVDVLAKILASLQKVVGDKGVSAVVGKSGKGGENIKRSKEGSTFPELNVSVSNDNIKSLATELSKLVGNNTKAIVDGFSSNLERVLDKKVLKVLVVSKKEYEREKAATIPSTTGKKGGIAEGSKAAPKGGIFSSIFGAIGGLFSGVGSGIGSIFTGVGGMLGMLAGLLPIVAIVLGLGLLFQKFPKLADGLTVIIDLFGYLIDKLLPAFKEVVDVIVNALLKLIPPLAPFFEMLFNFIVKVTEVLAPLIAVIAEKLMSALVKVFPYIKDIVIVVIEAFKEVLISLAPVIETIAKVIGEIVNTALLAFKDIVIALSPAITKLAEVLDDIVNGAFNLLGKIVDSISGAFHELLQFVDKLLDRDPGDIFESAAAITALAGSIAIFGGATAVAGFANLIGTAFDKISKWFGGESPMEKIFKLSERADNIQKAADAIKGLAEGLGMFGSLLKTLDINQVKIMFKELRSLVDIDAGKLGSAQQKFEWLFNAFGRNTEGFIASASAFTQLNSLYTFLVSHQKEFESINQAISGMSKGFADLGKVGSIKIISDIEQLDYTNDILSQQLNIQTQMLQAIQSIKELAANMPAQPGGVPNVAYNGGLVRNPGGTTNSARSAFMNSPYNLTPATGIA